MMSLRAGFGLCSIALVSLLLKQRKSVVPNPAGSIPASSSPDPGDTSLVPRVLIQMSQRGRGLWISFKRSLE